MGREDISLFLEIFGAIAVIVGGFYTVGSTLISNYFKAKEESQATLFRSIQEKIDRFENSVDGVQQKVNRLSESTGSAIDSKVRDILVEIKSVSKSCSETIIQIARLQEKMGADSKHVAESLSDFKVFVAAATKRLTYLESETKRIGQDLIIIRERKPHGR